MVIANQILYLAKTYNILSKNHFKDCKKQLYEQAVNVLIEKIYDAWKEENIVNFIILVVQRVYNKIKADLITEKFWQKKITKKIIK